MSPEVYNELVSSIPQPSPWRGGTHGGGGAGARSPGLGVQEGGSPS